MNVKRRVNMPFYRIYKNYKLGKTTAFIWVFLSFYLAEGQLYENICIIIVNKNDDVGFAHKSKV